MGVSDPREPHQGDYEPPEVDDWRPGDHRPERVSDPRELAAVVRTYIEGHQRIVDGPDETFTRELAPSAREPLAALDALVVECEDAIQTAHMHEAECAECERQREEMRRERDKWKALNEQHTEECAALEHERDRQYERAEVAERERDELKALCHDADAETMMYVARARRYEEALTAIANDTEPNHYSRLQSLARAALTEEQNTVGGGQAGC